MVQTNRKVGLYNALDNSQGEKQERIKGERNVDEDRIPGSQVWLIAKHTSPEIKNLGQQGAIVVDQCKPLTSRGVQLEPESLLMSNA